MIKPQFPDLIDNSLRGAFIKCPLKAYNTYWRGLAHPIPSIHLHAGGAFARGVEVTRKSYHAEGMPIDLSIGKGIEALLLAYGDYEYPEDSVKSPERLVRALEQYFAEYPLGSDAIQPFSAANGEPAIEFTFAIPLEDAGGKPVLNPDTGNPLLYAGRFDMLGVFNGSLLAVDEKTTSQLGPTWAPQWEMASQLTGYCWAAREYGYPVIGAVIRGVCLLKHETKIAPQVLTYRPYWRIRQWHEQLLRDVNRMLEAHRTGTWDVALDHACNDFGGCGFRSACLSPEPERWLSDFVVRFWNPLERGA